MKSLKALGVGAIALALCTGAAVAQETRPR